MDNTQKLNAKIFQFQLFYTFIDAQTNIKVVAVEVGGSGTMIIYDVKSN